MKFNDNINFRLCICRALIMIRNKGLLEPLPILELFFGMFRVKFDKNLREFLKQHIVADIKNTNRRTKSTKLNNTLQNFMFTVLNVRPDSFLTSDVSIALAAFRSAHLIKQTYYLPYGKSLQQHRHTATYG